MTMQRAGVRSGELTKATISNLDDPSARPITVLFNPTQYTLSKSNSWQSIKVAGSNVPRMEFTSGGATTLNVELLFDTYESGADVRSHVKRIEDLTRISPKTRDKATKVGRPPRCLFSWGKMFSFAAVITSLNVRYSLFLPDGTPVRAWVTLALDECEDAAVQPKQNPTSQGTVGHKVHIVQPGETLDWIAYQEYDDPAAWRFIADVNGLDNPADLRPGQVLEVHPLES
jgi:hypothetical protein